MPTRVYELARELNYSLTELEDRQKDLGLILNSPFSMVPDAVAVKVKGKLESRDANPCLDRKKPVRKAVKRKPKPKKVVTEAVEIEEASFEESSVLSDTFSEVNEEVQVQENQEVVSSDEIQHVEEQVGAEQAKGPEPRAQQGAPSDPSLHPELGKISQQESDSSEDEFQVGRIVGEAPSKGKAAEKSKKKKKKALVDPSDRLAEWSTKYGVNFQSNNNIKKREVETKGSKLQRMQLVYGHELPKKVRARDGERESVQKDDTVQISCPITLKDLSEVMSLKTTDVITWLMGQGMFLTINDKAEKELCESIALQFEKEVEFVDRKDVTSVINEMVKTDDKELDSRPPVITIMGHVDHGKTSLLDTIRQSKLADGESGGITQHIGGYQVEKNGNLLTFLDTPGHAAFTSMRARGANITDMVVLVVAADDGMMPQTEEAVNHAKAAGVPIVVAINKMDLEGADPNRVKEQLAAMELIPEEWSGNTPYIPVSAKTGEGVDDLLEMLSLQTEMLEIKADFKCLGEGVVVEAHQEPGRGVVASILVQNGHLSKGDPILCGKGQGFLRQMEDEDGKVVKEAGPSKIVKVTGLSECPSPGDILNVMPNIKKARDMADERLSIHREEQISVKSSLTMDSLMEQLGSGEVSEYNVIVKADVQGSVEALDQALCELGNEEVRVKVIHKGVGAVTEADVSLAKASGATILSFRVSAGGKTRRMASDEGVEIRQYSVIYSLLEETEQLLEGMLEPERVETLVGEIEVRVVFRITGAGNICGSYIKSGYAERGMPVRLVRDGTVVYDGTIRALRRFKEDVKRVENNYECGVRLENFEDIREGDIIETYHVENVKKTL